MTAQALSKAADDGRIIDCWRFSIFAALAAAAVLAWHTDIVGAHFGLNWQTLGFLAAVVVLVRPSSPAALLTMAAVETVSICRALPQTNTNRLLQLFVVATLTATGIDVLARFRRLDRDRWLRRFQPLLRLQLLIVYAFAAWDKLNGGFFNLQDSCAVHMYLKIGAIPPGDLLRWLLIIATVATEASLPFLLTFRRTRNLAVCYGVAFHVMLGIAGFFSFSMTMIALLFLFSPDGFLAGAAGFWRSRKTVIIAAAALGVTPIVACLLAFNGRMAQVVTAIPIWHEMLLRDRLPAAPYWLFLMLGAPSVCLYVWLWRRAGGRFKPSAHCCRPTPLPYLILPALLVFDCLTPYLGLKTETAFAMYSNLRTEGGPTNHWIWRHRLDLADYQQDLVRILKSNDPVLQAEANSGLEIPFFSMRERVATLAREGVRNISITYARDGATISEERAESVPQLSAAPTWLERKLLIFRRIQLQGCPH